MVESEIVKLEILLHNITGEKRRALAKAWSYRATTARLTIVGLVGQAGLGILALPLYALLPPMVFER